MGEARTCRPRQACEPRALMERAAGRAPAGQVWGVLVQWECAHNPCTRDPLRDSVRAVDGGCRRCVMDMKMAGTRVLLVISELVFLGSTGASVCGGNLQRCFVRGSGQGWWCGRDVLEGIKLDVRRKKSCLKACPVLMCAPPVFVMHSFRAWWRPHRMLRHAIDRWHTVEATFERIFVNASCALFSVPESTHLRSAHQHQRSTYDLASARDRKPSPS